MEQLDSSIEETLIKAEKAAEIDTQEMLAKLFPESEIDLVQLRVIQRILKTLLSRVWVLMFTTDSEHELLLERIQALEAMINKNEV